MIIQCDTRSGDYLEISMCGDSVSLEIRDSSKSIDADVMFSVKKTKQLIEHLKEILKVMEDNE
jgi:hypothetical protein